MDVILHIGAHRTGTTTFQHYMRAAAARLAGQGVGFWGPLRTRKGLFHGIAQGQEARAARRGAGRVQLAMQGAAARGVRQLLVSDENMPGVPRTNLRQATLYPEAGLRMARFATAFGPAVCRVVLTIRPLQDHWASVLAYAVPRGVPMPTPGALEAMAQAPRSWRDLILDVACALPEAEILVLPFDDVAGRPDRLLSLACDGVAAPPPPAGLWANRAPDLAALRRVLTDRGIPAEAQPQGTGRWRPFSEAQASRLAETYADDLFWLLSGADGLATLIEDTEEDLASEGSTDLPPTRLTRGPHDDRKDRAMAQPR